MEGIDVVLRAQLAILAADDDFMTLTDGVLVERDTVEVVESNGVYWSGPSATPFSETVEWGEVTWDIWAASTKIAIQTEARLHTLLHHDGVRDYDGVIAYSRYGGSDRLPGDKDVGNGRRIVTTIIGAMRV